MSSNHTIKRKQPPTPPLERKEGNSSVSGDGVKAVIHFHLLFKTKVNTRTRLTITFALIRLDVKSKLFS